MVQVSETSQEEGRNYFCLGKSRKRLQTAHVNMNWNGNVLVDTDDTPDNKGKMHLGTTLQQSFNYTISQQHAAMSTEGSILTVIGTEKLEYTMPRFKPMTWQSIGH